MGKHGRNFRGPQSQAKRSRVEDDAGDRKHTEDAGDAEEGGSPKAQSAGYVSYHAANHPDGLDERGVTWLAGRAVANTKFEKFYRAQPIFTSDEDYATFLNVCNTPLPVTFRVNILHAGASDAMNAIRTTFGSITKGEALGEEAKGDESAAELAAPLLQPIPWFPRGVVFQFDIGRVALRKSATLSSFHAWVTRLNSNGVISRQELVSMLPPILLGVRPEHRVLDMCASPGSKTAQLLEALHGQEMPEGNIATVMSGGDLTRMYGEDGGCVPTGFVVANDKDSKRAYMLVHQTNRIASHCLVVTNHDASEFPKIKEARPSPSESTAATGKDMSKGFPGYFDRVLCDVPCSGDGTMRKNAEVFAKWSPAGANGLHPLQVTIAMRGLQTLKVGGLMAYSTCTFNPIEDEAVLSEVLRRCGGAVELVDLSDQLPGFLRLNGTHTWTVFDNQMESYTSFEDAKARVPEKVLRLTQSMFPPPEHIARDRYHLERSIRVMPHQQDTGGFFIALLRKTGPLPRAAVRHKPAPWMDIQHDVPWPLPLNDPEDAPKAVAEVEPAAAPETEAARAAPVSKPKGNSGNFTVGEMFTAAEQSVLEPLFRFYGIADADAPATSSASVSDSEAWRNRPGFPSSQLMTRSAGGRAICVGAAGIVTDCVSLIKRPDFPHGTLKVLHTGMKVFECGLQVKTLADLGHLLPEAPASTADITTATPAPEAPEGAAPVSMMCGAGAATPFRVCQEGLGFVAPFVSRQVVYASGLECAHVLSFKGQQIVPSSAYTPRLAAAFAGIDIGSVIVVCTPALDGFEQCKTAYPTVDDAPSPAAAAALTNFYASVHIDEAGHRAYPKTHVPASAEASIPPLYRVHYKTTAAAGSEEKTLEYCPQLRVYPGINPLARVVCSVWKGKFKVGVMAAAADVDELVSVIASGGYTKKGTSAASGVTPSV